MAEDKIEFFGQVGKWVAVKKLKANANNPIEIVRFLVSVENTMSKKKWDFLRQTMDLDALDEIAAEICGATQGKKGRWELKGRVSEEKMNAFMAKSKSNTVSKKIGAVVSGKIAKDVAKTYVARKVLELIKFPMDLDVKQLEKYMEELRSLKEGS